jgi:hypothetical protein
MIPERGTKNGVPIKYQCLVEEKRPRCATALMYGNCRFRGFSWTDGKFAFHQYTYMYMRSLLLRYCFVTASLLLRYCFVTRHHLQTINSNLFAHYLVVRRYGRLHDLHQHGVEQGLVLLLGRFLQHQPQLFAKLGGQNRRDRVSDLAVLLDRVSKEPEPVREAL